MNSLRADETHLICHELGDPLCQFARRIVENHFQHVSIHLLHDNIDLKEKDSIITTDHDTV